MAICGSHRGDPMGRPGRAGGSPLQDPEITQFCKTRNPIFIALATANYGCIWLKIS